MSTPASRQGTLRFLAGERASVLQVIISFFILVLVGDAGDGLLASWRVVLEERGVKLSAPAECVMRNYALHDGTLMNLHICFGWGFLIVLFFCVAFRRETFGASFLRGIASLWLVVGLHSAVVVWAATQPLFPFWKTVTNPEAPLPLRTVLSRAGLICLPVLAFVLAWVGNRKILPIQKGRCGIDL